MKIELEATENGIVTAWTLDADGDYWFRHAMDNASLTSDTLFPTRDAAMSLALKLAAEVQPEIVTEGRIDDAGTSRPAPDDNPGLRGWLEERALPRRYRLETRAVDVSVVATENGAAVRWCREDRALITRRHAPTVVIDGMTYTGEAVEVVEAESPWFRRQRPERDADGWKDTDRVYEVAIHVERRTMRFAVRGGA